jgi:hypothetical protein
MAEGWVRNLDVQVRLAGGRLALQLDRETIVLDPAEAAVWRTWESFASPDEIASTELSPDACRALWDRLAAKRMIQPEAEPT